MTNIPRVKIYHFHISSVTRSPHGTQRNQTYDPRSQHKARFPTFSLIRPRTAASQESLTRNSYLHAEVTPRARASCVSSLWKILVFVLLHLLRALSLPRTTYHFSLSDIHFMSHISRNILSSLCF